MLSKNIRNIIIHNDSKMDKIFTENTALNEEAIGEKIWISK
jgi:hypothetical protein